MSVRIRLSRHGAKKKPFYRIVVSDQHFARDGRYIEQVGTYDPITGGGSIKINHDKVESWIKRGAQPTETVSHLIAKHKKAS
jgi:small subunit ribosomal protein S16